MMTDSTPTELALDVLRLDPTLQSRVKLDFSTIESYANLMKEGVEFEPILVVLVDDQYYVRDGFHRVKAAKLAGFDMIVAEVTVGTLEEARWEATGANKQHGKQRTRDDVRRAIEMALLHPRSAGLSDRAIALHVGTTGPTVGSVRKALEATAKLSSQTARTGADGRTINTANIGKKSGPDTTVTLATLYDRHAEYGGWVGEMNIAIDGIGGLLKAGHVVDCKRRGPSGGIMRWYQITPEGCAALGREPLGVVPEPPPGLYPGIDIVPGQVAAAPVADDSPARRLPKIVYAPDRPLREYAKDVIRADFEAGRTPIDIIRAVHNGSSSNIFYSVGLPLRLHSTGNALPLRMGQIGIYVDRDAGDMHEVFEIVELYNELVSERDAEPTPPATVVHFHQVADHWDALAEEWRDEKYVYIGRSSATHNLPQSPWHNPFKLVNESQRDDVIARYRDYITPKIAAGELDPESLRGKTLVCWCHPKRCHGDVLVELLQESTENIPEKYSGDDAAGHHLPDVDENTPPEQPPAGPVGVGDWVRTGTGHQGRVTEINGRMAVLATATNGVLRRAVTELTVLLKVAPAAPAEPVAAPPFTPDVGRVIAWIRETLRSTEQADDRVLYKTNDAPVHVGDLRALIERTGTPAQQFHTYDGQPDAVHWLPPVPWRPGRFGGDIEGADGEWVASTANMVTNAGPVQTVVDWIVAAINERFPDDYNQPVTLENAVVGEFVYYFEHIQTGNYRRQWTKVEVTKISEKRIQITHPGEAKPKYVEPRSLCRRPFGVAYDQPVTAQEVDRETAL